MKRDKNVMAFIVVAILAISGVMVGSAQAALFTWTNGVDRNWKNVGNWEDANGDPATRFPVAGDTAIFTGSGLDSPKGNTEITMDRIVFASGAGQNFSPAFALWRRNTGTIVEVEAGNSRINIINNRLGSSPNPRILLDPGTTKILNNGSGELRIYGDKTNLAGSLSPGGNGSGLYRIQFDGSGDTIIYPEYSLKDNGGRKLTLLKTGTGTLTLQSTNTYTGGTSIDEGTIQVDPGSSLGANSVAVTIGTGSAGSLGTVGNLTLNETVTVGALTVLTNNASDSVLTIASGKTFTASSLTAGVSAGLNGDRTGLNTGTIPGAGGTFNVNGNVTIGLPAGSGSADVAPAIVDLSGLNNFNATSTGGYLRLGYGLNSKGTLTLANDNVINVGTLSVGDSDGKNYNKAVVSTLKLGAGTNALQAPSIVLGRGKGHGVIEFAGSTGSVTITGAGGSGTADITIGNHSKSSIQGGLSQLALAGHHATVSAGTVVIGQKGAGNAGNSDASLTFDTGTFTANSIEMGVLTSNGDSNGRAQGTFTLGTTSADTGLLTVNGDFVLARNTSTSANKSSIGTFIINGGTATINGAIKDESSTTVGTSTTTLTLAGGTLDMTGHAIGGDGSSGNRLIDNLNLQSGTLKNVLEINGGAGLTKTTSGTLVLDGNNSYGGSTIVDQGQLLVNGKTSAGSDFTVSALAAIGGMGTIGGSLTLLDDANFVFDASGPLEVDLNVSLPSSFGIDNVVSESGSALDWSLIADGTYTLIDNESSFANIENFGMGNSAFIGGSRYAYFQQGSLQLVVVTVNEPATAALGILGIAGLILLRRRK